MKQRLIIIAATILVALFISHKAYAGNRGVPFIRNYAPQDYNAHNRNFDVACDDFGSSYFANFEGLLYYDGSSWRKIHSEGINRVTRVVIDRQRKRIWYGGYNSFGYIDADKQGRLVLRPIASDKNKNGIGEVDMIKVTPERVYAHTLNGRCYYITQNDRLIPFKGDASFIELNMGNVSHAYTNSVNLFMLAEGGFRVEDGVNKSIITEDDGLCSNSINFMMYDLKHSVWGATDHGIFAVELPSPYSHLNEGQGLRGEVFSISQIDHTIYVGTLQGLYRVINGKVSLVGNLTEACWNLTPGGNGSLLASTTTGLYRITNSSVQQITSASAMSSILAPQGGIYVSEIDSLYYIGTTGRKKSMAPIEKGAKMRIVDSNLHVETINGQVWLMPLNGNSKARMIRAYEDINEPKIEYIDELGRKWITDPEGKELSLLNQKSNSTLEQWTRPLAQRAINAIFCNKDNSLWVGGDFGIINFDMSLTNQDVYKNDKEELFIRQVVSGDSVLWGGYSPTSLLPLSIVSGISLPSSMRMVTIYFSTKSPCIVSPTKYRYRINGGRWSQWTENTSVHFNDLPSGSNEFEVQGMDLKGSISNTAKVNIYIYYPFYLKWWAILLYIAIIGGMVIGYTQWRQRKLLRDKAKLESLVNKRTQELSVALEEKERMQANLVRMERTATAGKLTEGLIDRILNPLNYINNFSKLTSGLAKDLREDIEDEKDNMSEDNYDDCQDILDMMTTNLEKIEDHGVNTTRTLRAMEAMLHTKAGTLRDSDVAMLCRQVAEVAADYHQKEIAENNISFTTQLPEGELHHNIDPESMNNVLMALLSNAFYAVAKKHQQQPYNGEVQLRLSRLDDAHIEIIVHDNGIGIEDSIKEKVFDPFFTTKTTGEAAGVGLYLAREIIQDHKGIITFESEKDNWTNVLISL